MKKLLLILLFPLSVSAAETAVDPQTGDTYIIDGDFSINTRTGQTGTGSNGYYTEGSTGETYRQDSGTIERNDYSGQENDSDYDEY